MYKAFLYLNKTTMKKKEIVLSYSDNYTEEEKMYLESFIENLRSENIYKEEVLDSIKEREDLKKLWERIEKEFDEFIAAVKRTEREFFIEEAEEIFQPWTYIAETEIETRIWKNNHSDVYRLNSFQEIVDQLLTQDYYEVSFTIYKDKTIKFVWTHHNWRDTIYFAPINLLSKKVLKQWIEDEDDMESIREKARKYFDKPYSQLKKDELIELIENYYI